MRKRALRLEMCREVTHYLAESKTLPRHHSGYLQQRRHICTHLPRVRLGHCNKSVKQHVDLLGRKVEAVTLTDLLSGARQRAR